MINLFVVNYQTTVNLLDEYLNLDSKDYSKNIFLNVNYLLVVLIVKRNVEVDLINNQKLIIVEVNKAIVVLDDSNFNLVLIIY